MSRYYSELEQALLLLQDVAFLVTKGGEEQKTHSLVIDAMLCIKNAMNISTTNLINTEEVDMNKEDVELKEVNKVCHKLLLWAKKPEQINSKILTTFLKLKKESNGNVTVKQLKNIVESTYGINFASNYNQMKNFGAKNHGKVFEEVDGCIYIWDKVAEYVDKYEKIVFK